MVRGGVPQSLYPSFGQQGLTTAGFRAVTLTSAVAGLLVKEKKPPSAMVRWYG